MLSPPTILEQLDAEPGGHEELRKLDFVLSAGGPLGPAAGNSISQVTRLGQFIGSAEVGINPCFYPNTETWDYFEWLPDYRCEMEYISSEAISDIFECVLP